MSTVETCHVVLVPLFAVALSAGCIPPPRPPVDAAGGEGTDADASDVPEGEVGPPDVDGVDGGGPDAGDGGEVDLPPGPCWQQSVPTSGSDAGTGDATSGGGEADGGGPELPDHFAYERQYEMRFDSFQLTNDSPGSNANTFLTDFMDQSREYPIVVLLRLQKIDMREGSAQLRGGAGLKADTSCNPSQSDCKYEWDPESEENYREVELDSRTGELRGQLEKLDFVGTNKLSEDNLNRFTLRIHDIEFSDAHLRPVDETCEVRVEDGLVEGYVTEEEAKEAKVRLSEGGDPIPLSDLLGSSDLNYDADGDGTDDSWQLTGRFSAVETDIAESN